MIVPPVSTLEGPDRFVRQFLQQTSVRRGQSARFDPENWEGWSEAEVAGCVRALAWDFLEGAGRGFDWIEASHRAEFVLAAHYYNAIRTAEIDPAPPWCINFYDPFAGEGIEVEIKPPSGLLADPLPGTPVPKAVLESRRARATLMVPPAFNALAAADTALWTGVKGVSDFFQTTGRLPLIATGAALVMWKALQASHQVRAGSVYRGIREPSRLDWAPGEMRVAYARSGDHIVAAVSASPAEATVFLE